MKHKVVLMTLVTILAVINFSIFTKEEHLKQGESIYLELAPVDPRSLMQGDYMALRYVLANALYDALPKHADDNNWRKAVTPHNGKVIVTLNDNKVASYQGIYEGQGLKENERTLNYRVRNNQVKIASNAFFFEEGTAEAYEASRYGEFRVNSQGELLLNAMFDEDLKPINLATSTQ
ncbi:GDYXXLXY domain-containing protein [Psychromonas sp. KJ10-10]|uniref:GDYXXLXY domain-containing protein n=1 Tax=Psychromonas sp. KJ10-10 TaxID=3391823 RepID=UPI0039B643A1